MISYQDDQGFDEKVITDSVLIENIRDFGDFEPNTSIDSSTWSEIDSTNAYIEALMTGSKWGDVTDPSSTKTELNYYIYDDETTIGYYSAGALLAEEETAYIDAMGAYSDVANISFTESNSINDAHILWAALSSNDLGDNLGTAFSPEGGAYDGSTTLNLIIILKIIR